MSEMKTSLDGFDYATGSFYDKIYASVLGAVFITEFLIPREDVFLEGYESGEWRVRVADVYFWPTDPQYATWREEMQRVARSYRILHQRAE